jgi:hypothetical protein
MSQPSIASPVALAVERRITQCKLQREIHSQPRILT